MAELMAPVDDQNIAADKENQKPSVQNQENHSNPSNSEVFPILAKCCDDHDLVKNFFIFTQLPKMKARRPSKPNTARRQPGAPQRRYLGRDGKKIQSSPAAIGQRRAQNK